MITTSIQRIVQQCIKEVGGMVHVIIRIWTEGIIIFMNWDQERQGFIGYLLINMSLIRLNTLT